VGNFGGRAVCDIPSLGKAVDREKEEWQWGLGDAVMGDRIKSAPASKSNKDDRKIPEKLLGKDLAPHRPTQGGRGRGEN